MMCFSEEHIRTLQLIRDGQDVEREKQIEQYQKQVNESRWESERKSLLKFFDTQEDSVELVELKKPSDKYVMSEEVKRMLWPIQNKEEEKKHWEMFNYSRGRG